MSPVVPAEEEQAQQASMLAARMVFLRWGDEVEDLFHSLVLHDDTT